MASFSLIHSLVSVSMYNVLKSEPTSLSQGHMPRFSTLTDFTSPSVLQQCNSFSCMPFTLLNVQASVTPKPLSLHPYFPSWSSPFPSSQHFWHGDHLSQFFFFLLILSLCPHHFITSWSALQSYSTLPLFFLTLPVSVCFSDSTYCPLVFCFVFIIYYF